MSGLRTRIAPTPSGFLHEGNALNFLLTSQLAHHVGARVLLRIDDLDAERVRPAYIEDIFDSLRWLGISWDEGPRDANDFHLHGSQRTRLDAARHMLEDLRQAGHLYACTCSRKELSHCTCREDARPFETPQAAWRLRLPVSCPVRMNTWSSGEIPVDLRVAMPDPVLRQKDGSPAYQLASLADDVRYGITFIVRGEDLLPSSACQLYLAGLLGLRGFLDVRFLHHALITDETGRKLSKTEGAGSLRALRMAGETADRSRARAADLWERVRDQGL